MDPLFVSLQLGFCRVGIGNGPTLGGPAFKARPPRTIRGEFPSFSLFQPQEEDFCPSYLFRLGILALLVAHGPDPGTLTPELLVLKVHHSSQERPVPKEVSILSLPLLQV